MESSGIYRAAPAPESGADPSSDQAEFDFRLQVRNRLQQVTEAFRLAKRSHEKNPELLPYRSAADLLGGRVP